MIQILEIPDTKEIFMVNNIVKIDSETKNNKLHLNIHTLNNKQHKVVTNELNLKKLFKSIDLSENKLW